MRSIRPAGRAPRPPAAAGATCHPRRSLAELSAASLTHRGVEEVLVDPAADPGPAQAQPARIHRVATETAAQQQLAVHVVAGHPAAHYLSPSSSPT